jgi:hypothetical protein
MAKQIAYLFHFKNSSSLYLNDEKMQLISTSYDTALDKFHRKYQQSPLILDGSHLITVHQLRLDLTRSNYTPSSHNILKTEEISPCHIFGLVGYDEAETASLKTKICAAPLPARQVNVNTSIWSSLFSSSPKGQQASPHAQSLAKAGPPQAHNPFLKPSHSQLDNLYPHRRPQKEDKRRAQPQDNHHGQWLYRHPTQLPPT